MTRCAPASTSCVARGNLRRSITIMDASVIVWALLGVLLNALVLYVVIRLAITHALNARTPKARPALVREPSHMDADGL